MKVAEVQQNQPGDGLNYSDIELKQTHTKCVKHLKIHKSLLYSI